MDSLFPYAKARRIRVLKRGKLANPKALRLMTLILLLQPSMMPLE